MLPAPHALRPAMSDEQRTQMQAARMEILPSRLCCTWTQQPWHDVVVERQALRVSFNAALAWRSGVSGARQLT
jgi:hypothetical protein